MNEKQPLCQTLLDYVEKEYGCEPEYLWQKYPNYAVLRQPNNRKWFAVIMNVAQAKLGLDGDGQVEVMNVKLPPELSESLKGQHGFLPAYHMNKTHWLTVLLDGSVEWEMVKFLLDTSADLTASSKKKGI